MTTANSKSQPYRVESEVPFAQQAEFLDQMFEELYHNLEDATLAGATGDLFYIAATGLLANLTIGASGRFVRSNGTTPEWSTLSLPNAATVGDLPYASAANVLSMLADVATGNALISGGVATAPSWGKIGLTTHVTGDLPYANLVQATAASLLLGRGSAAGAGDWEEITLGTGLTMTNKVLSASGGGTWSVLTNGDVADPELVFAAGDVVMIFTP